MEGSPIPSVSSRLHEGPDARELFTGELSALPRRQGLRSSHARARFRFRLLPPPAFSIPKSGVWFLRGGGEARHHGKGMCSTRAGMSPVPSDRIVLEG
jgi:hypothetical protein